MSQLVDALTASSGGDSSRPRLILGWGTISSTSPLTVTVLGAAIPVAETTVASLSVGDDVAVLMSRGAGSLAQRASVVGIVGDMARMSDITAITDGLDDRISTMESRMMLVGSSSTRLASNQSITDGLWHTLVTSPSYTTVAGDVLFVSATIDLDGSVGATHVGMTRRGTTEIGDLISGVSDRIHITRRDRVAIASAWTGTFDLRYQTLGTTGTTIYSTHTELLVEHYRAVS